MLANSKQFLKKNKVLAIQAKQWNAKSNNNATSKIISLTRTSCSIGSKTSS